MVAVPIYSIYSLPIYLNKNNVKMVAVPIYFEE